MNQAEIILSKQRSESDRVFLKGAAKVVLSYDIPLETELQVVLRSPQGNFQFEPLKGKGEQVEITYPEEFQEGFLFVKASGRVPENVSIKLKF